MFLLLLQAFQLGAIYQHFIICCNFNVSVEYKITPPPSQFKMLPITSDNNENLKRIRIYLYYTPFYREFQEKSNEKNIIVISFKDKKVI